MAAARSRFQKQQFKSLKREDMLKSANAQELWKKYREQYDAFMPDVLIPRGKNEWTSYKKLYAAYLLYCKAVGWEPIIPYKGLGVLLGENFCRKTKNELMFGCVMRSGVFIDSSNGVVVEEVPHVGRT